MLSILTGRADTTFLIGIEPFETLGLQCVCYACSPAMARFGMRAVSALNLRLEKCDGLAQFGELIDDVVRLRAAVLFPSLVG